MSVLALEAVSYTHAGAATPVVREVSMSVAAGEQLVLTGASGSGKSTLLCLINGLAPNVLGGQRVGGVSVAGLDPGVTPLPAVAARVGTVFQNHGAQLFRERVADDVAFGPENLGQAPAEVRQRTAWAIERLGLSALAGRRVATLSGGERQRVAIAGVLAAGARVLLLDEPGSDLDLPGRQSLASLLDELRADGCTVLTTAHDSGSVLSPGARTLRLVEGQLAAPLPPPLPLPPRVRRSGGEAVAEADGLVIGHGRPVGEPLSLALRRGTMTALVGANGRGKSTLLWTLAGLRRPLGGELRLLGRRRPPSGRVGLLPQNPDEQLFADSVEAELGGPGADSRRWLESLGLSHRSGAHPFSLSRGERRRLALGAVLAGQPDLLLLDEPTSGLDQAAWAAALSLVSAEAERRGTAVLFATHQPAAVAAFADEVIDLAG